MTTYNNVSPDMSDVSPSEEEERNLPELEEDQSQESLESEQYDYFEEVEVEEVQQLAYVPGKNYVEVFYGNVYTEGLDANLVTVDTYNVTNMTATNATISTATITNGTITNGTIPTLNSTSATINSLNATSITGTTASVPNISVNNISTSGTLGIVGTVQASKLTGLTGVTYSPVSLTLWSLRDQRGLSAGTNTWNTLTLQPGIIANNGDSMDFKLIGAVANTAATKTITVTLNGLSFGASTALTLAANTTSTADWILEGTIWRASATSVDWNLRIKQAPYELIVPGRGQTVSNFGTNNLVLSVGSITTNLNDIVFNAVRFTYHPAQ